MPRYEIECSLIFDTDDDSLDSQLGAAHLLADTLEKTGMRKVEVILGEHYRPAEED